MIHSRVILSGALWAVAALAGTPKAPLANPGVVSDYAKLAENGKASAQVMMGQRALERGEAAEAFRWFLKAAEQGETTAQLRLADLYLDGRGVLRDAARAAHWYAMAVGQSAEAQWKLGALFQEGDGVQKSPEIAAAMYRRAADQGYADAQNSLASLYIAGIGVKQNIAEAMNLFRKAALNNCADAQINLAGLYYHGIGVPQNFSEARVWALKAMSGRPREAAELLEKIDEATTADRRTPPQP